MPNHRSPRARHAGRLVLLAGGLLAALTLAPVGSPVGRPVAAQEVPYTLEVSQTEDLFDGQAITIRVAAGPAERIGLSSQVRICRAEATYQSFTDLIPFIGGKCPDRPVSSSGAASAPLRPFPDGSGAVATLQVGTGTVQWGPATDPQQFSLTCDPANPCRLVAQIQLERRTAIDASTVVTFQDEDAVGACGGAAPGAVNTSGPDRLLDAWVQWTRSKCEGEGSLAASQAVLAGEGEGHRAFAEGRSDLTYSAVGASFPGQAQGARPSVSVPLAVNAVVVGVLGGYGSDALDWPLGVARPFGHPRLTAGELATLFGQGTRALTARHLEAIQARNPELADATDLFNGNRPRPLALAGSDGGTFLATRLLDTVAGATWRTPAVDIDGNPPDVPRGIHDSLAFADPPFATSFFELFSSRGQLKQAVAANQAASNSYGPIWVLTDLATAEQLGIPTVAVQNGAGAFVTPTRASLEAAVPTMQGAQGGVRLPDPATSAPGAYPLTFVEYAVAPTEPLVDAECAPRAASQAQLAGWLRYLTGPGQGALAGGLVPLPTGLREEAAAAVARVGTAAATGRCGPTQGGGPAVPPTGLPQSPTTGLGAFGSSLFGLDFGSSDLLGLGSTELSAVREADQASNEKAQAAADAAGINLPNLLGIASVGGLAGAVALLALALMGAAAGALSTGRPIRRPWRRTP